MTQDTPAMTAPPEPTANSGLLVDGQGLLDALADANRRAIFSRLLEQPMPVKVIAADMPISQPAVSQHLKVMKEAGLVQENRQGRYHYYAVNPLALDWLSTQFGALRDDVLNAAEQAHDAFDNDGRDPVDSAMERWARSWPEQDMLSTGLIVRLFMIVRYIEVLSERASARHGISLPELQLLGTLDRITPRQSTLAELAATSLTTVPSAARHLNRIEQRGLIERSPSSDGRAHHLSITAKGRQVLRKIIEHEQVHEHAAIYQMAEKERLQLARLLRPLLRDLQDAIKQPPAK
ncbi:MAG: metalloregulator ArsR/SmtB family transcription factor [Porticoccaceae bacterium]